jgi:hypothetical protein
MRNVMIAAAVAGGLAFSSNTAFAYNWLIGGPGPNDYCSARAARVYQLPPGIGAVMISSRDKGNPWARSWVMMRVERDPLLKSTIDSQGVSIASVVDVEFHNDCSAAIYVLY